MCDNRTERKRCGKTIDPNLNPLAYRSLNCHADGTMDITTWPLCNDCIHTGAGRSSFHECVFCPHPHSTATIVTQNGVDKIACYVCAFGNPSNTGGYVPKPGIMHHPTQAQAQGFIRKSIEM